MDQLELKTRLNALSDRIDDVEARLKFKSLLKDGHAKTVATLRQRYKALSKKVDAENAEAEAVGHHVGDLERSFRWWLDSLEMDVD